MAGSGNGQVTVDVGVRLQVLQSSVADMQKILAKLKPDSGGFKELSKIINDTKKEIDQLQVQTSKPFGSQKQFDQVEKTIDKVEESLTRAKMAVDRIDFSDLKLDNSQTQQLEDLKKKIEDINKAFNAFKEAEKTSLFGNADFKKFADTIDPNLINKSFDQVVKAVETKTNAINTKLQNSLENLNKYSSQIKIGANIEDFLKKGGITEKALGVEKFQEMFTKKSTFKSGGKNLFFEYLKEQFSITDAQINQLKNLSAPKIQELISSEEFWQPQLKAAKNATKSQVTARTEYNRLAEDMEVATKAGQPLAESLERVSDKSEEATTGINKVNKEISTTRQEFVDAAQGTESFSQSTSQMQQELEGFKNSLASANAEMINLQRQQQAFNSIKMAITNFMGFNQVLNITKKAVKEAMDHIKQLDTVMNGIAIVSDMTTKDLWQQVDMYSEMAQNYGTSIKGAYEVSKIYYQAGYETNDVLTLMNETLKMSKISGLDYATTTDYMMNALRGFKLEVEDASRVVDVYSGLAQNTAVSQQELAEAMSKTASSMEGVGSTFEETSAMIATMVAVTRESANNIGSAMKSIASRYGELTKDPTKMFDAEGEAMSFNKVDEALQSIGITLQTTDHQFRSFTDVILELSDVWDTLTSAQQRYIATQFAGNRQQNRFLALVGNKELLRENLDVSQNSEDVGTIQALKSLDSLESKLNQVEVAYQQFYTTIGAEEIWKDALDGIKTFINTLNSLPKVFGKIPVGAIAILGNLITLIKNALLNGLAVVVQEFNNIINTTTNNADNLAQNSGNTISRTWIGALAAAIRKEKPQVQAAMAETVKEGSKAAEETAKATAEAIGDATDNNSGKGNKFLDELGKSGSNWQKGLTGLSQSLTTIGMLLDKTTASGRIMSGVMTGVGGAVQTGVAAARLMAQDWSALPDLIMGVFNIINGVGIGWENDAEKLERLTQEAENLNNEAKIVKADYNSLQRTADKLDELKEKRYESAEAAEEYQSAVEDLADKFPNLITSVDDLGNITIETASLEHELEKSRKAAAEATFAAAKAERDKLEAELAAAKHDKNNTYKNLTNAQDLNGYLAENKYGANGWQSNLSKENQNAIAAMRTDRWGGLNLTDEQVLLNQLNAELEDAGVNQLNEALKFNKELNKYEITDYKQLKSYLEKTENFNLEGQYREVLDSYIGVMENIGNSVDIGRINDAILALQKETDETNFKTTLDNILNDIAESNLGEYYSSFVAMAEDYTNDISTIADLQAAIGSTNNILVSEKLNDLLEKETEFVENIGEGRGFIADYLAKEADNYAKDNGQFEIGSSEYNTRLKQYLALGGQMEENFNTIINSLTDDEWEKFGNLWKQRDQYTFTDWRQLLPNKDEAFYKAIENYYLENGLNYAERFVNQIDKLGADYSNVANNLIGLDSAGTISKDIYDWLLKGLNTIKQYGKDGFIQTAENISTDMSSVVEGLNQIASDNPEIAAEAGAILKDTTFTVEGINDAISQLLLIDGIDESSSLIQGLKTLSSNLITNIPLTIQTAVDAYNSQVEDFDKALKNAYKGYNSTDIAPLIQKTNDYIKSHNVDHAPITFDDLDLKKGQYYWPAEIRELYIRMLSDSLNKTGDEVRNLIDNLFTDEGKNDLSKVQELLKSTQEGKSKFSYDELSNSTISNLQDLGLITTYQDETGKWFFDFTEDIIKEMTENSKFSVEEYLRMLYNASTDELDATKKQTESATQAAAIDTAKETQDQLNSAISELNMSVGKYLTDDTYELFKAAGIFDLTGFTVNENTKQIESVGNLIEAFIKFYEFLNNQTEATDEMRTAINGKIIDEEQKIPKLYQSIFDQISGWDESSSLIDISELKLTEGELNELQKRGAEITNDNLLSLNNVTDLIDLITIFGKILKIPQEKIDEAIAKGNQKNWDKSVDKALVDVFKNVDNISESTIQKLVGVYGEDIKKYFTNLGNGSFALSNSNATAFWDYIQSQNQELSELVGDARLENIKKQGKDYLDFAKRLPTLDTTSELTQDEYDILTTYLTDFGYVAEQIKGTNKYMVTAIAATEEIADAEEAIYAAIETNGLATSQELYELYEQIYELRNKRKTTGQDLISQLKKIDSEETLHLNEEQAKLFDEFIAIEENAQALKDNNITYDKNNHNLDLNASSAAALSVLIGNWVKLASKEMLDLAVNLEQTEYNESAAKAITDVLNDVNNVSIEAAQALADKLNLDINDLFDKGNGNYSLKADALPIIQAGFAATGEEMTDALFDLFYNTNQQFIDKLREAGDQIDVNIGDKISDTAKNILESTNSGYTFEKSGIGWIVKSLGDVDAAHRAYIRTLAAEDGTTAKEIEDARNDAIDAHRKDEKLLLEEMDNVAKAQAGDWVNVTNLTKNMSAREVDSLSRQLQQYGAFIRDGILKISDNANILEIQRMIYKTAQEKGKLLDTELASLADAITDTIAGYGELISNGINGKLNNVDAVNLQNFASNYGIQIDFHQTEQGLKLSQQSAMALYTTMKQVDYLQSRVVFKELSDNLKESTRSYQDVVAIQGRIADLQKQINSLPVGSARRKEYERELEVAKEIREVRSLTDENAFNFMNNDLPTPFKAQLGYWDSIGSAFKEMNDAADSGYMDVTKFYNMVNGFNDMAKQMGTSINFMGMELDGSMESASKLIQKGFSSLANVDGEGAKISLERFGNSFEDGAKGMQNGVQAGVREMAKSNIKMLDAMIAFLETIVAFDEFNELDKNGNGLESEELFKELEDGTYVALGSTKKVAANILKAAKSNKDLEKGLKQLNINGINAYNMLQKINSNATLNKKEIDDYTKIISITAKAAASGDFSTQNLTKLIQEAYGGTKELVTVDIGDQHFAIKGNTVIERTKSGLYKGGGKTWKTFERAAAAQALMDKEGIEAKFDKVKNTMWGDIELDADTSIHVSRNVKTGKTTYTYNGKAYTDRDAVMADALSDKYEKAQKNGYQGSLQDYVLEQDLVAKWKLNAVTIAKADGTIIGNLSDELLKQAGIDTNLVYAIEAGVEKALQNVDLGTIILDSLLGVTQEDPKTEEEKAKALIKRITNSGKLMMIGSEIATGALYAIRKGVTENKQLNIADIILDGLLGPITTSEDGTSKWETNEKIVELGRQLGIGIFKSIPNGIKAGDEENPDAIPNAVAAGAQDSNGIVGEAGQKLADFIKTPLQALGVNGTDSLTIAGMDAAQAFVDGFTMMYGQGDNRTSVFGEVFGAQIMDALRQALITDETRAIGQETVGTLIEGMTASDGKSSSKVQQLADSITGPIKTALTDLFSQTTLDDLIDLFKTNSDLVLAFDSIDISSLTETVATFETAMATANTALGGIIETINGLAATGPLYAAAFALAVNSVSDKTPGYAADFTTAVNGVKEDNVTQSEEFAAAVNSVKTEKVDLSKAFVNAIASVTKEQVNQTEKFVSAINDIKAINVSYAHSFKGAINGITNNGPNAAVAFKNTLNSMRSKNITVTLTITDNGGGHYSWRTGYPSSAKGNFALVKGNTNTNSALAKGRKTLMGELGPELYVTNGRYYVAGQNGAEMVDLPDDAIVFNHLQTKRLLGTGRAGRGKPVTNEKRAVSYATGNASGPAMASAKETLEQLKALRAMWKSMLTASFKQLGGLAASNKDKGKTKDKAVKTKDENGNETTTIIKISRITDDINRWYNLMRQIDKLEKDISYSEQLINKYQSDRVVNGNKIYQNYKNQLKMLDSEISKNKELVQIQRDWYNNKREEIANSSYGLIFQYDENGLLQFVEGENRGLDLLEKLNEETVYGEGIRYSSNAERQLAYLKKVGVDINALAYDNSDANRNLQVYDYNTILDRDKGEYLSEQELADWQAKIVQNWLDTANALQEEADSLYDAMHETEEKILDEQIKQNEILQEITNNQLEVEDTVLNAIIDAREAEIDELQKERDAYQDSVDRMISGLNDALDNEQRMYEDNESRSELTKLQRQLAILQRSGGSASQIRDLQNQITSQQKDLYFDERQKEIQAIQDASDKQIERMDAQIDLMNDTLAYQKEHGLLWAQVYGIMSKTESDILGFITENGADWEAKSSLQKQEDIRAILEKIQIWTQSRDDKELQELGVKIDNQEATTANRSESSFNSGNTVTVTASTGGSSSSKSSSNSNKNNDYNAKNYNNSNNDGLYATIRKSTYTTISDGKGKFKTHSFDAGEQVKVLKVSSTGNAVIEDSSGNRYTIRSTYLQGYDTEEVKSRRESGGIGEIATIATTPGNYQGYEIDKDGNRMKNKYKTYSKADGDKFKILENLGDYLKVTRMKDGKQMFIRKSSVAFKSGGLIDFTGPAWVDGSKSKPESILSADQTKSFREFVNELKAKRYMMKTSNSINFEELYKMRDALDEMRIAVDKLYDNPNSSDTNNMGITIENVVLNMNVSKIANDYDAARAGQKVLDEFVRVARKNGVNSLSRR